MEAIEGIELCGSAKFDERRMKIDGVMVVTS